MLGRRLAPATTSAATTPAELNRALRAGGSYHTVLRVGPQRTKAGWLCWAVTTIEVKPYSVKRIREMEQEGVSNLNCNNLVWVRTTPQGPEVMLRWTY